jgi:putative chitinase
MGHHMLLTPDKLAAAVKGCTPANGRKWAPAITEACGLFHITTEPRLAAYLAHVGHESDGLAKVVENLNYSTERLREVCLKADPGTRWRSLLPRVGELARNPEKLANAVYGGRMSNGPEASGEGWLYRGRGLIQVTGRANYLATRDGLAEAMEPGVVPDFVRNPELLEQVRWAALSAGQFWHDNELNELADSGDFTRLTKRINGGLAGLSDRQARFRQALAVLTE